MKIKNKKVVAHIVATITVIIWGTTFISTKVLLSELSPIMILFTRFVIAYMMLWIVKPKKLKWQGKKREAYMLLAGIFGISIYFLCENIALTKTMVSNVGVIVSTAPMFTAILSALFVKKEKMNKWFFLGFVCAMSGIALISFRGQTEFALSPIGDLLSIGAAFVWAIYTLLLNEKVNLSSNMIEKTRRIIFYGIITLFPVFFFAEKDAIPGYVNNLTSLTVLNLLYLGIFASAMGYVTWNFAVDNLGSIRSSVYIYVIPAVTVVASVIVLKEPLTLTIVVGTFLTILGLLLSNKKNKK